MKQLDTIRRQIRNGQRLSVWRLVTSRDGFWKKVDDHTRVIIDAWIRNHQHTIHSPLKDDTVNVPDVQKKTIVKKTKLLLQCSIRELHLDMYKSKIGLGPLVLDDQGKPLVSDTMFRSLLPPELRVVTNNYKQTCCCQICCSMSYLQAGLNRFRVVTLTQLKKDLKKFWDRKTILIVLKNNQT